jgi:hypothetical protein
MVDQTAVWAAQKCTSHTKQKFENLGIEVFGRQLQDVLLKNICPVLFLCSSRHDSE